MAHLSFLPTPRDKSLGNIMCGNVIPASIREKKKKKKINQIKIMII